MASNSFSLFASTVTQADDELRPKIVRILFDLFMVHDIPSLVKGEKSVSSIAATAMSGQKKEGS